MNYFITFVIMLPCIAYNIFWIIMYPKAIRNAVLFRSGLLESAVFYGYILVSLVLAVLFGNAMT